FEHRNLMDNAWARRPYPGDAFVLPFGKASVLEEGSTITLVSWGAMVQRCEAAALQEEVSAEIIDLRTLLPWDCTTALESVQKTRRCLIVHEDSEPAGFGAEIAAFLAQEAFLHLDAPVERLATPHVPIPYNVDLMNAVIPGVDQIAAKIRELVEF